MYKSFMQIVQLKKYDALYQFAGFILMLYFLTGTSTGPFALYIMAGVQLVSVFYWALILHGLPVKNSRKNLQRIFLIASPLLLLTCLCSLQIFFALSVYLMFWLGPLLGISYFITTIEEIRFYRGLVHRDAV
jgi:hypothetical protein